MQAKLLSHLPFVAVIAVGVVIGQLTHASLGNVVAVVGIGLIYFREWRRDNKLRKHTMTPEQRAAEREFRLLSIVFFWPMIPMLLIVLGWTVYTAVWG